VCVRVRACVQVCVCARVCICVCVFLFCFFKYKTALKMTPPLYVPIYKNQALSNVRESVSFIVLCVQLRGHKSTECVSKYFCNSFSIHTENTQLGKQLEKYK
jgi:hypothetical protein